MVTLMPFSRAADAAPNSDNWIHTGVLVLNASYEALTDIGADRAVVLLITGGAETVAECEPRLPIRSKHMEIALPQTIRLLRYVYLEHHVLVHDESRATLAGVLRVHAGALSAGTLCIGAADPGHKHTAMTVSLPGPRAPSQ